MGHWTRVQEELAIAELELHEARIDKLDVEGLLGFAEHLIGNAARAWMEANLEQRQQIQSAIFPEGLPFDGQGFGTARMCLAFKWLEQSKSVENDLASLGTPSWNQIVGFLESMRQLRDSSGFAA
jgi:hypothetical protein